MGLKPKKPSPALVVSCIALLVALGPAVRAADTIGSSDIIDESILSQDIKDGEVRTSELAIGSVTSVTVLDNSLTTSDLKGANVNINLTFGAGAFANGRCRNLNFVTAGANLGEAVVVSLKGAVAAGMLFQGVRVPSAGRAIIKVCNLTGGISPAMSNLPLRILTFG